MLNGLKFVNVELTSRCNKGCWMCGRRKMEKDGQKTDWGDMPASMAIKVARQIPEDTVVAFHSNGEPLLYESLGQVLPQFKHTIRCLDTNGKLLVKRASDIINNLDTITISVIQNDPEGDVQFETVKEFLGIKHNKKPRMIYRLLGEVKDAKRWYELPGIVATRVLHSPMGSFAYEKKVTVPEIGICLEALTHLVVDRYGNVYPCVRFNPNKKDCFGNVRDTTLDIIWNSNKRKIWLQKHIDGKRNENELCKSCDFWGIPRGV